MYFTDAGRSDTLDNGDRILLLKDATPPIDFPKVLWSVTFQNPADTTVVPVNPRGGDAVEFSSTIPFNATLQDIFTIYPRKASAEQSSQVASELAMIKVVPNPYLTASRFEQKTPFRTGRGERIIKFTNLPTQCTIRIYNIAAEHVVTLHHEGTLRDGSERAWNLLNKDGLDVAPGLYIYHIDAPGIGETIGRFAIIK